MRKLFFKMLFEKKKYVFLILLSAIISSYSQTRKKEFDEMEKLLSFKYSKNPSFEKNITSTEIECDYSIISEGKNIEILYSIIPSETYKEGLFDGIFKSIALLSLVEFSRASSSLTSNEDLISEFDSLSVAREFNADWGGTSSFVFASDEFCGYKFCVILFLYKKDRGLVITYFLFNNQHEGLKEIENNFHNLVFK